MDYNQNNQIYPDYQNYQSNQDTALNPFAVASMICGIMSVLLCCTGILSLPLGSLGILFAVLSKRTGKPMSPFSITGIILSIIGLLFGIIMCVYALTSAPEYNEDIFEDYDSFEEYYEDYYNDDYEDYDDYTDFYDFGFEDL